MLRIFHTAFNEIHLNLLELELLLEIINDEVHVNAVLTGIDIG